MGEMKKPGAKTGQFNSTIPVCYSKIGFLYRGFTFRSISLSCTPYLSPNFLSAIHFRLLNFLYLINWQAQSFCLR